jgi:hypothetical protein
VGGEQVSHVGDGEVVEGYGGCCVRSFWRCWGFGVFEKSDLRNWVLEELLIQRTDFLMLVGVLWFDLLGPPSLVG